MPRERTTDRITARLRFLSWPTAAELAADLHMKDGTVRKYLNDLVIDGVLERRVDDTVSNPSGGGGASRYSVRDVPLGPIEPTTDRLCTACMTRAYGDEKRYYRAFLLAGGVWDADDDEATCDRCGARLLV